MNKKEKIENNKLENKKSHKTDDKNTKTIDKSMGIVMPGDDVTTLVESDSKTVIGSGIVKDVNRIVAFNCGILKRLDNSYAINSHQKRYIPSKGNHVIGIVMIVNKKFNLKVDIGTCEYASLDLLTAFGDITKKIAPNIRTGDVIYALIKSALKDSETILTCITKSGKKQGMGSLGNGVVIAVPIEVVRWLLSSECTLLEELKKRFRFEIRIGMNGRIWIDAKSYDDALAISDILTQLETFSVTVNCDKLYQHIPELQMKNVKFKKKL